MPKRDLEAELGMLITLLCCDAACVTIPQHGADIGHLSYISDAARNKVCVEAE